MAEDRALLEVLRRFARRMTHRYDVSEVLYELCDHVTEVVRATGAGVALVDEDGVLRFITASSDRVVAAEEVQEATQSGPCMTALRQGRPEPVRDVAAHADRWPGYCEVLHANGLASVLGVPLVLDEVRVGSLDVYDAEPREWTEREVQSAAVLADVAAAYVLGASELTRARRTAEQLQQALDSRVVIEQAKGMLAERLGTSPDEAFRRLRVHARSERRKLHDVCTAVIEHGFTPR